MHRVAEAGNRRLSLHLESREFTVDHFAINNDWLEVSKFVEQFTFLILATKEVDSFLHRVALK